MASKNDDVAFLQGMADEVTGETLADPLRLAVHLRAIVDAGYPVVSIAMTPDRALEIADLIETGYLVLQSEDG